MAAVKSTIRFETQRANKTRWVKQAQREGKCLKQWIEDKLNDEQKPEPE